MLLKRALPLSVVSLAAALAGVTWYAMLTPFWAVQAGERDARVFYSQGFGLWLNYTEHVGDAAFDPGNSLWIPPQPSAIDAFSSQWYNSHPRRVCVCMSLCALGSLGLTTSLVS
ncbi:hypothetical protein PINS_up009332 [Pythium insidiosum]|nr:hypothetical protein PINS_up009332 [Pythium insidiosum]